MLSARPVTLIGVPYHLGQRDVSMGRGPRVLLADDRLPARLRSLGLDVEVRWVDADEPQPGDQLVPGDQMSRHLVHNRHVARLVAEARAHGRTPILSSGNCNSSIGVVSGLADDGLGMVWLDAHPDASTPDTSLSGLFDGMPVATIAGRCWQAWAAQIPGFRPIAPERMVMVGMHDLDVPAAEQAIVGQPEPIGAVVGRAAIDADGFEEALSGALDRLAAAGVRRVYLHVDTDVLDHDEGRASHYTAPGGLPAAHVRRAIELVNERFDVLATTFSAYDPDVDPRMADLVTGLAETAVRSTQRSRQEEERKP